MKLEATRSGVDDGIRRRAAVATLLSVTMISVSGIAWAQSPRAPGFHPEVAVGSAYDDNIFWRPIGTADLIQRVTPSVEMHYETPRLSLSNGYRFDAERYTEHPELSTPFARGNAGIEGTIRPSTRTVLALRAEYQRTQTASELNVTTGLATGRRLASHLEFGSELTQATGPRGSVAIGYVFGTNRVVDGIDSQSHSARFRFARRVGVRDDLRVAYLRDRWVFLPGEPASSHIGTVGWSRRLTPVTKLTLEGGPCFTASLLRPEVSASLVRHVHDRADVSLSYSRTHTVAVGVAGLIETDRVQATVAYRQPAKWDVMLAGGPFRDVMHETKVIAYLLSMEAGRALAPSVSLVASVGMLFNDRKFAGPIPLDEHVRRNSIALSLQLSPRSPR